MAWWNIPLRHRIPLGHANVTLWHIPIQCIELRHRRLSILCLCLSLHSVLGEQPSILLILLPIHYRIPPPELRADILLQLHLRERIPLLQLLLLRKRSIIMLLL